jgi:6-phosphogluconate dehydrogenase
MKKEIGYIGLGKMGSGMVQHLLEKGYDVVVYDMNHDVVEELVKKGARKAESIPEITTTLSTPRLVWVMVPHSAVDEVLTQVTPGLTSGDTIVDGGNSPYLESVRRGIELKEKGIHFLDAGISGGPSGARHGACTMVGGDKLVYEEYATLFQDISAPDAYGYMGSSGAGHFVKMVHNGIEYGMMQALAEGFAVLKQSEFNINLTEASRVYNNQSVIESRLVAWLMNAYKTHGESLEGVSGEVDSTGEGAWTVEAAKRLGVPVPIIEGSLHFREQSKGNPSYEGQILSALRNQFGGHSITS